MIWRNIQGSRISFGLSAFRKQSDSMAVCLTDLYLVGRRSRVRLKLSLVKKQQSLVLAGSRKILEVCVVFTAFLFLSVFRPGNRVHLFCLSIVVT